ncbi:uncharacterized protein F4822DRAFT_252903 [Hypoxylon trugodes]|uniref:uncharacterized protein n=1 Tax=Hypoxylon trugodes TaxID=326681 RepID=UPI00218E4DD1|nr:uncharacterized protein F4822DRAFT_252903 [Hypoxylon trugodes]KAI1388666.1 hypothetical protein F4822DRAFT_252903 [Hypoxylon trugodes]
MVPLIRTAEQCYCAICGGPFERPRFGPKENPFSPSKKKGGNGYNPDIISKKATEWLVELRILGYFYALKQGFISGRGQFFNVFSGPGSIHLDQKDPANEQLPNLNYSCYEDKAGAITIFPFHETCYKILAKVLYPDEELFTAMTRIDLEGLHSTMRYLSNRKDALLIRTGLETRRNKP